MHGRWYDPNVGRFITPDEKGEYLYGSGEDAINWVWSAGQGAICQFVNDEALGQPENFDKFIQGITNGERVTLYTTMCVENQGGEAFNIGAGFGRGTSYAISVVEIVGGIGGDFAAGGEVVVTFGGAAVIAIPQAAISTAAIVHGGAVIVRNLNAPMLMAKGNSNIANNKTRGDAFRDEIADFYRKKGFRVRTEVTKRTFFGKRRIDIEVTDPSTGETYGIETKTGGSPYTPDQRAKDSWLRIFQGYRVVIVRGP